MVTVRSSRSCLRKESFLPWVTLDFPEEAMEDLDVLSESGDGERCGGGGGKVGGVEGMSIESMVDGSIVVRTSGGWWVRRLEIFELSAEW